jgi:hypothetical protein
LTLRDLSVDLEDHAGGRWWCSSLDLGYPDVREVTNNRPDAHGIDDRTQFFGQRVVSADLSTATSAGAQIDAVASSFGPFMVPSERPVLHYVLDVPGAPERTMQLRAAGYGWKVEGAYTRDIHLQWIAADPVAYGAELRSATAFVGGSVPGRTYDLTFPRTYPPAAGAGIAVIRSDGDVPVQPLLRIWGPVTGPRVTIRTPAGTTFVVGFVTPFAIGAGAFVDVDTKQRTAYYNGDPNEPALTSLDWTTLEWPILPVHVDNALTLTGSGATSTTQVQAIWHDGFLA